MYFSSLFQQPTKYENTNPKLLHHQTIANATLMEVKETWVQVCMISSYLKLGEHGFVLPYFKNPQVSKYKS